ncbi:MAG: hypothetical protein H6622_13700 [Halobacteriovoraceae bacterium]|nr:hypothetical protein [Halobacteriovoraceae bacterium]
MGINNSVYKRDIKDVSDEIASKYDAEISFEKYICADYRPQYDFAFGLGGRILRVDIEGSKSKLLMSIWGSKFIGHMNSAEFWIENKVFQDINGIDYNHTNYFNQIHMTLKFYVLNELKSDLFFYLKLGSVSNLSEDLKTGPSVGLGVHYLQTFKYKNHFDFSLTYNNYEVNYEKDSVNQSKFSLNIAYLY